MMFTIGVKGLGQTRTPLRLSSQRTVPPNPHTWPARLDPMMTARIPPMGLVVVSGSPIASTDITLFGV